MSTTYFLVAVLAWSIGACTDGVDPDNQLYQRWQWIESRLADGSVFRADQGRTTIVSFKPSGEYEYEYNGRQFTCCQPNRFARQGNQLKFSYVAGGYVSPECVYMSCVSYQPEKIIDSLSAQRLVLSVKGSAGQVVYQAVR